MQDGKGLEHMQITDVRVRKVAKEGKLKAVVSITMDDEFVVHDIKAVSYTHLDVYKRQVFAQIAVDVVRLAQ